ncbi:hypothetical protein BOTBODRAFT_410245 [Botryobasidium botryosum FD-172 SS1]|uniref:Protein kinase domain-containing protein n=1 Tax=Botryobasidium botryosum (strain FD-172 SS1) TaxID=930990 RepID=A0A067MLM3_BOTB1|nr:hypothetical protein BOTBODRAFT_410245 [Botryobasidium botryosum FD-172 SS1]
MLPRESKGIPWSPPPKPQITLLSALYSAIRIYPANSSLHDCEIRLTKLVPVGQGGYSDCWVGEFLGCFKVAMKTLRAFIQDDVAKRRLKRETNVWSRLDHPNILPFIGQYVQGPTIYMVSPWMENGDALTYVQRSPDANPLQLLAQVAEGLSYLHKERVIHGDLKAANIFVSHSGHACIADFGLSEFLGGHEVRCSTEWYVAGHPRWQAPEILKATSNEEARRTKETDNFAYGRVMLELFTGKVPFFYLSGDTSSVLLMVMRGEFPERPTDKGTAVKGLDDNMWGLMTDCWNIDPASRPSAKHLVSRLQAALRAQQPLSDANGGSSSGDSKSRKRPRSPRAMSRGPHKTKQLKMST